MAESRRARRSRPRPRSPREFPESSCACQTCRSACLNSPGWFLPGEVGRLAAHFGIGLVELFTRYLAVGTTHMPGGELRYGVMPHKYRDLKKPGAIWSLSELAVPGRCIFYDRGRCTIHPVRPFECSRMHHSRLKQAVALRHCIVERWTAAALAPFAALLGRPLGPPPPGPPPSSLAAARGRPPVRRKGDGVGKSAPDRGVDSRETAIKRQITEIARREKRR